MNGAEAAQPTAVDITAGDLPEDQPDGTGAIVGFVSCPEALVSKLIGKKGAVIQNLEATTGAKIQVEHQKPGDPKHVRIVAKSQEELDSTKQTIKDTLESEHPLGEITKVVQCPHNMVGRIIGKAGQTILSLQQASQAKIIVDQDAERFPAGADRDVRIIGMAQSVDRAEKMVNELMQADPGVSAQTVIQKVRRRVRGSRPPAQSRCAGFRGLQRWRLPQCRACGRARRPRHGTAATAAPRWQRARNTRHAGSTHSCFSCARSRLALSHGCSAGHRTRQSCPHRGGDLTQG